MGPTSLGTDADDGNVEEFVFVWRWPKSVRAFCGSDWGRPVTRRSMSGSAFLLATHLVSVSSATPIPVSLSSGKVGWYVCVCEFSIKAGGRLIGLLSNLFFSEIAVANSREYFSRTAQSAQPPKELLVDGAASRGADAVARRRHTAQALHDRQVRREYKSSGLDDEALGSGVGGQPPQTDNLEMRPHVPDKAQSS
eukprot:4889461-Amphidinium_carterae.2